MFPENLTNTLSQKIKTKNQNKKLRIETQNGNSFLKTIPKGPLSCLYNGYEVRMVMK